MTGIGASRAADYTIKGFLYQFNKTLLTILESQDDSTITVEGLVEDVETTTLGEMIAIQCKYHEASESFTSSSIFKPLLQMMNHFSCNPDASIRYTLFAHYPSMKDAPDLSVHKTYLQDALKTENKELTKLASNLAGKVDLDTFLSRFSLQFGPTYDVLVAQACTALKGIGIPDEDIDTLAYPNAVNIIAGLSVKHDPAQRAITKRQFVEKLKGIRKTAISRWTLALRTRKQLLEAKRKELKAHLDINSQIRYFVINTAQLVDYKSEFALFVKEYLAKYHYKQAHIETPVFCLHTTAEELKEIEIRLFNMGIKSTNGYICDQFYDEYFFRKPIQTNKKGEMNREFLLRLIRWEDHGALLNKQKCEDLFIIGELDIDLLDTTDINVEHLAVNSLKTVKYVMGVSNVYE